MNIKMLEKIITELLHQNFATNKLERWELGRPSQASVAINDATPEMTIVLQVEHLGSFGFVRNYAKVSEAVNYAL